MATGIDPTTSRAPGRFGHADSPEQGSALLMALLVLGAISILATAAIVASMSDRNLTDYDRDAAQALATSETGIALA